MTAVLQRPLGEFCTFVGGGTPSRKCEEFFQGNIPWATVKDFKSNVIVNTVDHISELAIAASATNVVDAGTVLIVSRVGLGKVALAGCRLAINQDIKAVIPDGTVTPEYLFWALLAQRERIQAMGVGATVKGVTLDDLRSLTIPTRSEVDQRRIVDILSRAEGIVRLRREAEKKAAELIPALFIEMFGDPAVNPKGWPVTTVGASLQIPIRNGISPSKSGRIEGRVLTLSAITRGVFNPLAVKSANFAAQLSDSDEVKSEDFLICRGNGNPDLVGRGCFPDTDMPGVAFPDTAIAVRVLPTTFEKGFLATVWETFFVRDQIRAAAKTTNGTYKINQAALAAIALPRPPIDLQRQFAQRVEAIRALQTQQAAATAKAQASFDALLAQAFPA